MLCEDTKKMTDSILKDMGEINFKMDKVLGTYQQSVQIKRKINFEIGRNPNLPKEVNEQSLAVHDNEPMLTDLHL